MTKSVTLITQDFHPVKGGIAAYLMQIYRKYFAYEQFQVIVPNNIGQATDYQSLPFSVYRTDFAPFEMDTTSRRQTNRTIVDILRQTDTDIVLIGYLRSHPEAGQDYKRLKPSAQIGIITHAKEAFIDDAIVGETSSSTGKHQGYTQDEARFYKNLLKSADYVFCISQFTKNLLARQGIQARFHILQPSLRISTLQDKTACKIALGYAPEDFVALSVGRLINRKGQQRVLEILPNLQVAVPNIQYDIVGDGPNRTNIQQAIKANGLEERVQLHDKVNDTVLATHYGAADIFVLPTEFIPPNDVEGFGIVFLEAGMHQIPVIGGYSGGVPEAIVDGITGFLIDSNKDLKDKIEMLIKNKELRLRMGTAGRKRAIDKFNNYPNNHLLDLFMENTNE